MKQHIVEEMKMEEGAGDTEIKMVVEGEELEEEPGGLAWQWMQDHLDKLAGVPPPKLPMPNNDPHYWARLDVKRGRWKRERKVVRVRKEVTIKKEKTYPHLMPICTYLVMRLGQEGFKKLLAEEGSRTEEQLEEKFMARIKREPGVCQNPSGEKFRAADFDVEKLEEGALKRLIRGWESGLQIVTVGGENGGRARYFVVMLAMGPNYFNSWQPMVKTKQTNESTGGSQLKGVEQEVIYHCN